MCRVAQQSAETLQHMNPLVTVSARSGAPEADTDLSYLQDYQVVLLAGANLQTMLRYDQACTSYGVAFYTVTSRGSNSYFFANLHEHAYTITVRMLPHQCDLPPSSGTACSTTDPAYLPS